MDWASLISRFSSAKILVVGDICLDRWCQYDPATADPSRETGIARIGVTRNEVTPGAGGTVANNLSSLGAGKVVVLGAIGQDGFGFELERCLSKQGIDYSQLVATPKFQTFTYTKVINSETGVEDKPRIDFINTQPLPGEVEDQLIANFHSIYSDFDVILVSDQAETNEGGVVTPVFREVIADVADRNPDKIVIVDSRTRVHHFRGVLAKPNEEEADEACRKLFGTIDYPRLLKAIGDKPLVITRGARGALLVTADGLKEIPSIAVGDPVDTCGAGDAHGAGMALALYAGADIEAAARFGAMVASVTIMKAGTGVATPQEVLAIADSVALNN